MSTGDSEGPAWNKFWLSLDNESESLMSGEGSSHQPNASYRGVHSTEPSRNPLDRIDSSVLPNDSASHNGDSPPHSALEGHVEDRPFPFKFKAPSGRVHRLQVVASAGMAELIANVTAKLGVEIDAVGGEATVVDGRLGKSGYALSYLDNEGDTVSITTDQDLLDAISLARQGRREKVDLFVHDPEKPPMAATLDPQPLISKPPTPPASAMRERRRVSSDEEEDEDEEPARRGKRSQPQTMAAQEIIAGVPNDLLLPGAIAGLAVVIVSVFALTRSSSR